jgi:hypothetical protein
MHQQPEFAPRSGPNSFSRSRQRSGVSGTISSVDAACLPTPAAFSCTRAVFARTAQRSFFHAS